MFWYDAHDRDGLSAVLFFWLSFFVVFCALFCWVLQLVQRLMTVAAAQHLDVSVCVWSFSKSKWNRNRIQNVRISIRAWMMLRNGNVFMDVFRRPLCARARARLDISMIAMTFDAYDFQNKQRFIVQIQSLTGDLCSGSRCSGPAQSLSMM